MTADSRERQLDSMLRVLEMYPADLLELIAFVTEDTKAGDTAISSATFSEEL